MPGGDPGYVLPGCQGDLLPCRGGRWPDPCRGTDRGIDLGYKDRAGDTTEGKLPGTGSCLSR